MQVSALSQKGISSCLPTEEDVYEQATEEGDMKGMLEWEPITWPPEESRLFGRKVNCKAEVQGFQNMYHLDILYLEKNWIRAVGLQYTP